MSHDSGPRAPHYDFEYPPARLLGLSTSVKFAEMVAAATLESQFTDEELDTFRNPRRDAEPNPEDDPSIKCSIKNFIDLLGSSEDRYNSVRENTAELCPNTPLLLYDQVK